MSHKNGISNIYIYIYNDEPLEDLDRYYKQYETGVRD